MNTEFLYSFPSVLVVDDTEGWRTLLEAVLENAGYTVKAVSSYSEAIDLLQKRQFDVLVTDMRLIDTSVYNVQGIALIQAALRIQNDIQIIVITGYPDLFQSKHVFELGVFDYLTQVATLR